MRIHGIATVVQPPEVKETKGGITLLKIRLMDRNSRKRTQFWDGVIWGEKRVADYMENGLKKGDQVYVDGEIKQDEWGEEGSKKISYEMNLQELVVLDAGHAWSRSSLSASDSPETGTPPPAEAGIEEPPF